MIIFNNRHHLLRLGQEDRGHRTGERTQDRADCLVSELIWFDWVEPSDWVHSSNINLFQSSQLVAEESTGKLQYYARLDTTNTNTTNTFSPGDHTTITHITTNYTSQMVCGNLITTPDLLLSKSRLVQHSSFRYSYVGNTKLKKIFHHHNTTTQI